MHFEVAVVAIWLEVALLLLVWLEEAVWCHWFQSIWGCLLRVRMLPTILVLLLLEIVLIRRVLEPCTGLCGFIVIDPRCLRIGSIAISGLVCAFVVSMVSCWTIRSITMHAACAGVVSRVLASLMVAAAFGGACWILFVGVSIAALATLPVVGFWLHILRRSVLLLLLVVPSFIILPRSLRSSRTRPRFRGRRLHRLSLRRVHLRVLELAQRNLSKWLLY